MAGIYVHIPFCKTECSYCDFFTQTNKEQKGRYIDALAKEVLRRNCYLGGETVKTIYFGGGTPSQLAQADFEAIFEAIKNTHSVSENAEITLEANPDDLNKEYLDMLRKLAFNRISIGIQSFDDNELKSVDRRHTAQEAKNAVRGCKNAGFENISIDLMYGLPNQSLESWASTLNQAIELNVQHISSYHLIYEEKTKMHNLLQQGKITVVDEDLSLEMFSLLNSFLKKAGFIRYEISNFAKEGFYSQHNSSYWKGEKYLGIGASAHSFDGNTRSWNISSIDGYINGIETNRPAMEIEELTENTRYNDYILTGMRTIWGVDLNEIDRRFGQKMLDYYLKNVSRHVKNGDVEAKNNKLSISEKGLFVSDTIMSDLMYID